MKYVYKQKWVNISGFKNYQISNYGYVKSFAHTKPRILKPSVHKDGHISYTICKNNINYRKQTHRLVLECFEHSCPNGLQCCHNDGDPKNNFIENLRWGTVKENAFDRKKHGTNVQGEKQWNSTIKSKDIPVIFNMRKKGITYKEIGEAFGVGKTAIWSIIKRKSWKHLTSPQLYNSIRLGS